MTGVAESLTYSDAPVRGSLEALRRYGDGAIRKTLDAQGQAMDTATTLRFVRSVAPDGSPWKVSRRVAKRGGKTLVLHAFLRNSLTHNVFADNRGFEWGSPMVYAAPHQFGDHRTVYARSQSVWRGKKSKRFVKKGSKGSVESHVTIQGKGEDGSFTITIPARPLRRRQRRRRARADGDRAGRPGARDQGQPDRRAAVIVPKTIADRLTDQLMSAGTLRFVGEATDYVDFLQQLTTSRSAFVLPGSESAKRNTAATQVTRQEVLTGFTVMLGFVGSDTLTPRPLDDLIPVREAVKGALVGWTPTGERSPIEYDGAKIVEFDSERGLLIYQVDFFNSYHLRA
ncbi:MAG: phage virion morphogenesis protein [Rhizomicrobium sp.]